MGETKKRDVSMSTFINKTFIRNDYHDFGTVTMRCYLTSKLEKLGLPATHGNNGVKLIVPSQTQRTLIPFPTKLHLVVSIAESEGFDHIISWQPHGRCFLIHKPQEFVDTVLPIYFDQTRITSFQRQLNMYGFLRLSKGPDKGCYYHELFLKHKLFLCQDIVRIGKKGTGVKLKMDHSTEPDFYSMRFVEPDPALPPEVLEWPRQYEFKFRLSRDEPNTSRLDLHPYVRNVSEQMVDMDINESNETSDEIDDLKIDLISIFLLHGNSRTTSNNEVSVPHRNEDFHEDVVICDFQHRT